MPRRIYLVRCVGVSYWTGNDSFDGRKGSAQFRADPRRSGSTSRGTRDSLSSHWPCLEYRLAQAHSCLRETVRVAEEASLASPGTEPNSAVRTASRAAPLCLLHLNKHPRYTHRCRRSSSSASTRSSRRKKCRACAASSSESGVGVRWSSVGSSL